MMGKITISTEIFKLTYIEIFISIFNAVPCICLVEVGVSATTITISHTDRMVILPLLFTPSFPN